MANDFSLKPSLLSLIYIELHPLSPSLFILNQIHMVEHLFVFIVIYELFLSKLKMLKNCTHG